MGSSKKSKRRAWQGLQHPRRRREVVRHLVTFVLPLPFLYVYQQTQQSWPLVSYLAGIAALVAFAWFLIHELLWRNATLCPKCGAWLSRPHFTKAFECQHCRVVWQTSDTM